MAFVSVIGIALVALSMIIVLSVFNGFERFTTTQFSALTPNYIVQRVDGKAFSPNELSIPNTHGVLKEPALASYEENSTTITLIGIEEGYHEMLPLESLLFDGSFDVGNEENPLAVTALALAYELGTGVEYRTPLTITVPKRIGRISMVMPSKNFNTQDFVISGTLRLDQLEDSKVIFLPIQTVRHLLQYNEDEVSYLALSNDISVAEAETIAQKLPDQYELLDRYQQHPEVYRVLKVEKWVSFLLLFFVLILSLFGVVSTLGMLVLEKRDDTDTLRFMGAREKMIDTIIVFEGWLLSITGLVIGLSLGVLLVLLQANYGFVKFAGGSDGAFIINTYPVELRPLDLLWVGVIILLIGWLSSRLAYRLFRRSAPKTHSN